MGQFVATQLVSWFKTLILSHLQKKFTFTVLGAILIYSPMAIGQVIFSQRTLDFDHTIFSIEQFGVNEGLPSNNVIGVTQSRNGHLFMGTINGLARYNGHDFTEFNPSDYNVFVGQELQYPVVDRWKNVWATNQNKAQLLRFDMENYNAYPNYWSSSGEDDFLVTNNGHVLIVNDRGVHKYIQGDTDAFQLIQNDPSIDLFTNALGDRSFLLTSKAFYEWVEDEFVKRFDVEGEKLLDTLRNNPTLFYINDEQLFAHDGSSLYLIDLSSPTDPISKLIEKSVKSVKYKSKTSIQAIINSDLVEIDFELNRKIKVESIYTNIDAFKPGLDVVAVNRQNESVFSVYYSLGVLYLKGHEVKGISDVTSILIDEEGIIWVSSGRMGLFKIRTNKIKNFIYSDRALNSYTIAEFNNRIVASSDFGIMEFDSSKNQLKRIFKPNERGLPKATLGFTFVTKAEQLLVSPIDEGLWEYNKIENEWFPLDSYNEIAGMYTVRGVVETEWGCLIFGLDGLVHTKDWDEFSMVIDKEDLSEDQIRSIAQLDSNRIIIGTRDSGLWVLDSTLEINKLASIEKPIDHIRYIEVASPDTFYLGGWNRGIRRVLLDSLQNIKEINSFKTNNGLPNNDIHTLIMDKNGYLWVSSNGGMGRVKRKDLDLFFDEGFTPKFEWFGQNDGIVNQEFNGGTTNAVFRDSNERLWFANQDGIILVDTDELEKTIPTTPYKLTIDRVYIEDEYQNTARIDTISLKLGDRRIAFFYGLPDYTNSIINYEYRLNGIDENWIYNSSRKAAIYSELKPGIHTFEVRAIPINDSTPAIATMTVVVPHYLYEKSWFQILLGGILLSVLLFTFTYQSKRLVEWRRLNVQEQKANEEKQRLFDGIAHELRTPLSLVIHPLERIQQNYKTKKTGTEDIIKKDIETSLKNAGRLNYLVDQISDIRQISLNNNLPVKIEPIVLTTYFFDLLNDYVDMGDSLDVIIEYNIPTSSEVYFVDKKGIDRIFNNLIMNAIRYNQVNGKVRIQVVEEAEQCHLIIANQGIGIAPKDLPYIFDYLYQGDNASNSKGSGIGLFLVKYWADEMGAELKVESEPYEWTTFTVSFTREENIIAKLPLDEVSFEQLPLNSRNIQSLASPVVKGPEGSQIILLVDDEIEVLESLSSSFKSYFTIWRANNALDALEIVNREQVELVITDIKMPSMNGPKLVAKMRETEKNNHIPVIYYSALTSRVISRDRLNTGADIFVSKTISLNDLMKIVEDVLLREKRISLTSKNVNKSGSISDLKQEIEQIVLRHLSDKDLKADWIADQLYMSRAKLYRKWKEISDVSLNDYIKSLRIKEAKYLLLNDPNISSHMLANLVGYSSSTYFVKQFEKEVGVKPSDYKIKNP